VLTNAAHQQPATVAMPAVVGERFNAAAWLVDRMAAEHPRRTAVTVAAGSAFGSAGASAGASAEDGCDVSYGELAGQVTAAAAALVASGVRAEERVLLCMADGLELMSLFLGALRIGAVPVPVSTMLTAGDLSVLALDSRARLLAVTPDTTALAVAAAGSSPYLRDVVVVGDPLPLPPSLRVRAWSEFLAAAGQAATEAVATPELTVTDSPGFWLYTSGTTGTPKGAMHRHGSLRDTAQTYAREVLAIRPDDVCYSMAKLFFAYGLGNCLTFRSRSAPVACSIPPDRRRRCRRHPHPLPADAVLRRTDLLRGAAGCRDPGGGVRQRTAVPERRRAVPGRALRPVHPAVRRGAARRHRFHRGAAHLSVQPARPGAPGDNRGAGGRLRPADRRRRGRRGGRRRARTPLRAR